MLGWKGWKGSEGAQQGGGRESRKFLPVPGSWGWDEVRDSAGIVHWEEKREGKMWDEQVDVV